MGLNSDGKVFILIQRRRVEIFFIFWIPTRKRGGNV